jgi:hypothetical protein
MTSIDADTYFNDLLTRVDRVIDQNQGEKPSISKQLLSEHSLTAPFCKAKYDFLSISKRQFLFSTSLFLIALCTGIYGSGLARGYEDYSTGGGWCIVTVMYQSWYWLLRTCLRRPDKTGHGSNWWYALWFLWFIMLFGLMGSWVTVGGIETGDARQKTQSACLGLLGLVYSTQWAVELVLLFLLMKMDSRCLTTTGDDTDYLIATGLAEDEYAMPYKPPQKDELTPVDIMPSTIDI